MATASSWSSLPSPLRVLGDKIRQREPLLAQDLLDETTPQGNLLLLLGELYFRTEDYSKSTELLTQVFNDANLKSKRPQESHALYRLSDCHHWQGQNDEAYRIQTLFATEYSASTQAPAMLLRKAVAEYSQQHKPSVALETLAELERRYSRAPEAESAAAYRITILHWIGSQELRDRAIVDLRRKYPIGDWAIIDWKSHLKDMTPKDREIEDSP